MKKKRVLKQWVVDVLVLINIIAILFLSSECNDTIVFISSKLIGLIIVVINTLILIKYSNLFKED